MKILERSDEVISLRYMLATEILSERFAVRRSRRHEHRAAQGLTENPAAALSVAAGYQRDARASRANIVELRAALARVEV